MLMQVANDPNGQTQRPLQVMRTAPGGPDNGQADKSVSGKVALAAGGVTVQLGTVPAGKTWYVTDLFFQLSTSTTADVSVQAGGVPVWVGQASATPIGQARQWPVPIAAGTAVTLVFGAPGAGTPNGYFDLGILEQ